MTYNWSAQVYSTQVTVVHGMVRFTGHESEYTKSKDLTLLYNEPILIYIYVCVCVYHHPSIKHFPIDIEVTNIS